MKNLPDIMFSSLGIILKIIKKVMQKKFYKTVSKQILIIYY
jgi:hypothetical protein